MTTNCPLCKDGVAKVVVNGVTVHESLGFMWTCTDSPAIPTSSNSLDDILYAPRTPGRYPLTRRDLLEHLMQECAEVIQAASKCILYGYDRNWPGYGVNHEVLETEIGQLEAVIHGLGIRNFELTKLDKIAKWKHYMRTHSEHGEQKPGDVK